MKRKLLILLLLLVVGSIAFLLLREHLSTDAIVRQETALRQRIEAHPILALLLGFVSYTLLSLIPATSGKSIVYGWFFGFWAGLLIVNGGLTLAAIVAFVVVRYALQDLAQRKLRTWIRHVNKALDRDGAIYLVSLRLLHAPYSLTNYIAGATTVRTRTFWWTTQLGLLPGNIAYVLAGSQLPTLEEILTKSFWELVDVPLLVGLSAVALLPIAARWGIRRWRARRKPDNDDEDQ